MKMVFTEAEQAEIEKSGGRVVKKKTPEMIVLPTPPVAKPENVNQLVDILSEIAPLIKELIQSRPVESQTPSVKPVPRSMRCDIERDDKGKAKTLTFTEIE